MPALDLNRNLTVGFIKEEMMMKIDEIIRSWKDPEYRSKMGMEMNHPAGPSTVSDETLASIGGGAGTVGSGCILTEHNACVTVIPCTYQGYC